MKTYWPRILRSGLPLMLLLLLAVLLPLLGGACLPGHTLFSNDAPLGRLMSACHQLPGRFTGCWEDLNSIGYREEAAHPCLTYALELFAGPLWFSKLYALFGLLLLGLSAWCLFRQLRLSAPACILGALAAMLNSTFFSAACWGVASHAITVAMAFLALAALADVSSRRRWLRVLLAGFALGMAVTEGADIGAIFSAFIAVFIVYQAFVLQGSRARNLATGALRLALVTACAAFLAVESVSELLDTSMNKVVASGAHETLTKQGHWDWATQWSLPKVEALGLVVPGLFGFRIDTPEGGCYWGSTGQDSQWERYLVSDRTGSMPMGFIRYVGGGSYAGVPVVVLALWAAVQSLRRKDSAFTSAQQRSLWFWGASAVLALLLAFGRHAPFYRLVYALPYFSTIRNPAKYLHVFSLALSVLFAYGVDGFWHNYMQVAGAGNSRNWLGFQRWWAKAGGFDKRWVQGCGLVLGLSLVAWVVYDHRGQALQEYLKSVQFNSYMAELIANFSIRQVGWFVLFFVLTFGLTTLLLSGAFTGPRATSGAVWLGLVLVFDLGRANLPWIKIWDYEQKYATNVVLDKLRDKPYEHRVANLPVEFVTPTFQTAFQESDALASAEMLIYQLYLIEWSQHLFFYYNVQSLNIVQLSRKPEDLKAFEDTFQLHTYGDFSTLLPRYWQLTNTRYLVVPAEFESFFNNRIDPSRHRFHIAERFRLTPKPGTQEKKTVSDLTPVPDPEGPFALLEFTGALPRAKLYSNWLVCSNNQSALNQLTNSAFDPEHTVLLASQLPAGASPGDAGQDAGTVEIAQYAPRHITLKANPARASVLLLNDRFDTDWNVRVDGAMQPLLRCNYLMRGVFLPPGAHTVEFRFQPQIARALYLSLAAMGIGLALLGIVTWSACRTPPDESPGTPENVSRANPRSQAVLRPAKRSSRPQARPQSSSKRRSLDPALRSNS